MKRTFAIRLEQWAREQDRVMATVADLDKLDELNEKQVAKKQRLLEDLDRIAYSIHGYCVAVDDVMGYPAHGRTEILFYRAKETGAHRSENGTDVFEKNLF